jgi:ADP-heptose:LPS heptosyltransferase
MSEVQGTFAVIQLNRLGDLIQSHQTVKDLKLQHPNVIVKLIAREEFYKPLAFLLEDSFDDIVLIKREELLNSSNEKLENFIVGLNNFLGNSKLQNIDVVINQSFCQTSNYLMSLIPAKHRLGTFINPFNQVVVSDQWSQLVYSMVMGGPNCPFHLVDIFKNQFGIKTRNIWANAQRHIGEDQTLAIHPFASQDKKYWKPQKWSEVIFKLLKETPDIKVKIFGSTKEKPLADQMLNAPSLKRFLDRVENHVGGLSLKQVTEEFKNCSHFVGHDSALGHLAKEVGLATLTISLGTVRPIETAPYGINTFVLAPKTKCFPCFPDTECNFFQCHADLSYQAVTEIIRGFVVEEDINFESLKGKVSPFHLDSLNIYRFGPSNTGWYAAENIGDGEANLTESFRDILKVALTYKMEEIEENLSFPKISKTTAEQLSHLRSGVEQLFQLCEFGKKYSKDVLLEISKDTPSVEKIKQLGDKVQEVDQLMDLLPKAYPLLRTITDFYKVMKSNLYGENIVDISESSYLVYNDNSVLCSLLYELIGNTVSTTESGRTNNKGYTKEGNA